MKRAFRHIHEIAIFKVKISLLKALLILAFVIFVFIFTNNCRNPPIPLKPTNHTIMPGVADIQFSSASCENRIEEIIDNQFISKDTTCLYFRFDQDCTNLRNQDKYLLHLELYKETGELFMDFEKESHIDEGCPGFTTFLRIGIDDPGYYWPTGKYYAYISIDGKLFAQGSYEIVGPQ